MKKTGLFFLPFCLLFLMPALPALEDIEHMPEKFNIKELFTWRMSFEISSPIQIMGTVHRKMLSWTPQYRLTNPQGELLATSTMKFWEFLPVFDLVDKDNLSLGSIKEDLGWIPSYTVISPKGQILANVKRNFWGTKFSFFDPVDGHELVILSRSFFQWKADWEGLIKDPTCVGAQGIHPHVFFTIIAFNVERSRVLAHRQQEQIKGLSDEARENDPLEELETTLESYRSDFEDIDPQEEDFLFVEEFTEPLYQNSNDLSSALSKTLALLSDTRLTQQEKAALFLMLESRFWHRSQKEKMSRTYPSPKGLCGP